MIQREEQVLPSCCNVSGSARSGSRSYQRKTEVPMVVAQAVHTARGKIQVIGDQARKRPKDLSDMHQHVNAIATKPAAFPSWTWAQIVRPLVLGTMNVDPPQPARVHYHQLRWPTRPFSQHNDCDIPHLRRTFADTHRHL